MKLVSYETDGAERAGAVVGDKVLDLAMALDGPAERPMLALLAGGDAALDAARRLAAEAPAEAWVPLAEARLLAPIPRPGKIVAIGRNYADHAAEMGIGGAGAKPGEKPRIIAKLPSSVVGPGAVVERPAGITKLDYEVELGVVIGRRARDIAAADALAAVAGYTVLDDLSARELQFDISPPQTTFAKSMDGFCPMGPWIVTRDEIPDPQKLDLKCWVNETLLQDSNTRYMIFDVATIIAYISGFMTLEPGDVIATGTPAGVGAFMKPPRYLQPGDRIRLDVAGVGRLEHSIG